MHPTNRSGRHAPAQNPLPQNQHNPVIHRPAYPQNPQPAHIATIAGSHFANMPPQHQQARQPLVQGHPYYGTQGQPQQYPQHFQQYAPQQFAPHAQYAGRTAQVLTLEHLKRPAEIAEAPKVELEKFKKVLRNQIINMDTNIRPRMFVFQPATHQLEYLPQIQLGKHSSSEAAFPLDPLHIRFSFLSPEPMAIQIITKIEAKLSNTEKKLLGEYDDTKREIIDFKSSPEGRHHRILCEIAYQSHKLILPLNSTDKMKDVKSINGRSDGMKSNVEEFKKKERFLAVKLCTNLGTEFSFKSKIICCSTSSFQIALSPYRDEIEKIQELYNWLIKLYPDPEIFSSQLPQLQPYAQQPYTKTISTPEITSQITSFENLFMHHLTDLKGSLEESTYTRIANNWNDTLAKFPIPSAMEFELGALFGGTKCILSNIFKLFSSPFFGGFVDNPYKIAIDMEKHGDTFK